MKNHLSSLLLLFSVVAALPACRETSRIPEPAYETLPLIIPQVSSDTAKAYLNFRRSQLSDNQLPTSPAITNRTRPTFEFTINFDNSRDRKVKTVEVYKSFERLSSKAYPLGKRVFVGAFSSFPATVSLTSQQVLTGLQRLIPNEPSSPYLLDLKGSSATAPNAIFRDDAVVFTFEYIQEDGTRIILTPVSNTKVGNAPGNVLPPSPTVEVLTGSSLINAPYAIRAIFRDRF